MICAVRTAVPLGASFLPSWCISTISTSGKNLPASLANCIMSTAPVVKLGAKKSFAPPAEHSSQAARMSSRETPVVPLTTWTPRPRAQRMFARAASGWLKSTMTSGAHASMAAARSSVQANSPSEQETVWPACRGAWHPTTCMSSAAATAFTTHVPMRPFAPETSTLIIIRSPFARALPCRPGRARRGMCVHGARTAGGRRRAGYRV